MTSQINPNNIDGNYPVPGVPNNTQGFRSNFTETRTNFQYAAQEITALQNSGVFKAALPGTTLDNNMNDNLLYAVKLNDVSYTYLPVAATAGNILIDYAAALFQQITTTGPISLSFSNFPVSGTAGTVRVGFNITNVAHTVTLPAAVSQGLAGLQGVSPGTPGVTNIITFGAVGNYAFEFVTIDGGVTVSIFDDSRPAGVFSDQVRFTSNAVSTSATTGAVVVTGGVGIGGNLHVTGNIVGNIQVTGVNVTGNVSGNVLIGNAGIMTTLTVNQLSSDDSSFVNVNDGLIINGELEVQGNVVSTGNITGGNFVGTLNGSGANVSSISATNISSGTLAQARLANAAVTLGSTALTLGATVTTVAGLSSVTSTTFVGALTGAATTAGTVTTAAQPNITSVGTLTSVSVTGNVTASGTGGIVSTGVGKIGYSTGGAVTQATDKTTGVTLNTVTGEITMNAATLGGDSTVTFTMTNSSVANTDVMIMNQVGGGNIGFYSFNAVCNSGSANISVHNMTNTNRDDAIVIRYAVIKGAVA